MTPDDTLLIVWEDFTAFLSFHELVNVAKVSRRFKNATMLGGGSATASSSALVVPSNRSFHRFR
jgi:hypothetical protein